MCFMILFYGKFGNDDSEIVMTNAIMIPLIIDCLYN